MSCKTNFSVKRRAKEEAEHYVRLGTDKNNIECRLISQTKGRGVFACDIILNGSFIVEYRGIMHKESKFFRPTEYSYIFRHSGAYYCIDASNEDGSLGRLVNDDQNPNAKMKKIVVDGVPHLCLFAIMDILEGQEVVYDYGGGNLPWRGSLSDGTSKHIGSSTGSAYPLQAVSSTTKDERIGASTESTFPLQTVSFTSPQENGSAPSEHGYADAERTWHYVHDTEDELTLSPKCGTASDIHNFATSDRKVATGSVGEVLLSVMGKETPRKVDAVPTNDKEKVASGRTDDLASSVSSALDGCCIELEAPDTNKCTTLRKGENFCFFCKKPYSKIARHLKTHRNDDQDVAKAFSFPVGSLMRRKLLEKLRNRGNFIFNNFVLQKGRGTLKVRRKNTNNKRSEYCQYCKGMFVQTDLWRHMRRCKYRPTTTKNCKQQVLGIASVMELFSPGYIGVLNILRCIQDKDIAVVVRCDVSLIRFAEILHNKHGHDISKHDYLRQKIQELGKFLLTLQRTTDIFSMEDAIKPSNFLKIIKVVKEMAGFDLDRQVCQFPSPAPKIGHSLLKVCDIIQCRAVIAENKALIKRTAEFQELYHAKWSKYISHEALNTIGESNYDEPIKLPLTDDIVRLHTHLDSVSQSATAALKEEATEKNYSTLAEATLSMIVLLNRRRVGEISKMRKKDFSARRPPKSLEALSEYEKKLCRYFELAELTRTSGCTVAVLLTPEIVANLNLLVEQRKACGIPEDNGFLFAVPHGQTHFRGNHALRNLASECGAKRLDYLRSTQLRKEIAATSQIMYLNKNDILGHDIALDTQFYRLSEPTVQSVKISKLLFALEEGRVHDLQGKSLDEIEDLSDDSDAEDSIGSDTSGDADDPSDDVATNGICNSVEMISSVAVFSGENASNRQASEGKCTVDSSVVDSTVSMPEPVKSRRILVRRPWTLREISAVMRHFKSHIEKGNRATKSECDACKKSEHPALDERTCQNIRDFVRNKGLSFKRNNKM